MSPLGSEDNSPFLDLAGFPPSGECSLDFLRDGTVLCTTIERAVEMARQRYADSGFPVLSDYDSHFPSFEKEQRLSPTVKNQSGLFF
ncbi:hypothetical protein AGDE_14739 [Angomonas deanei]|uniref:Uncharacterized protein n=1 Tax=Angomonas deanei TaxID=59799 RepID=A0A7G2CBP4_9TRYP|nr:hypothetical protein AGDE_14739 [Angomonas deanei]CAD2216367.1 hypothetical protein, conserved [Angomonas deanei]|eukprot:EPY20319.1 hypothetical protein AGDE_14739 [Angomonas deanei]